MQILDSDFLYINVKRGNQTPSPGKPKNLGMKEGMIIDIMNPSDTSWKNGILISDHHLKACAVVKVEKSFESVITPFLKEISTVGQERARSGYIGFSDLEAATGIPNLEADLKSDRVVPIIDGTSLQSNIIRLSASKIWTETVDLNAVSSGSFTVGSGGDYATWNAALADIANLTGNLTFTQISDVTETAWPATSNEDLNGNTLTFTSDTPHNGDPNTGWLITINKGGAGDFWDFAFSATGGGTVEIEKLHWKHVLDQAVGWSMFLINAGGTYSLNVHDILGDGNGDLGGIFGRFSDSTVDINVWNCNVWDYETTAYEFSIGVKSTSTIENCTAYNNGKGMDCDNRVFNVSNVECIANTTDFVDTTNTVINYCASDDGTAPGANSVINITPEDENESLTDTDSDFLKTKSGSLSTAGTTTTISGNTVGIRGNVGGRAGSTPSIGSDEFAAAAAAAASASSHFLVRAT